MNMPPTYLGLDIAKLTLDLSPHPALPQHSYPNTAAGHRALLLALRRCPGPVHIPCEATGGYEHHLLAALHAARVLVTLLNPRLVRDFARASGLLAKTDRLAAAVLAQYGRVFTPVPTPPGPPSQQRLAELVARCQVLLRMRTQEHHCAAHQHDAFVQKEARALTATLQRHLARVEAELAMLQRADPARTARIQRLCAIQGVGQHTAWQLLAALPELGTLAPYNHDSGPRLGPHRPLYGRLGGGPPQPDPAPPLTSASVPPANRPKSRWWPSCANWSNSPIFSLKALPSPSPTKDSCSPTRRGGHAVRSSARGDAELHFAA